MFEPLYHRRPRRKGRRPLEEESMSQPDSTGPGATLGDKNLSTIHAVAQSLAIGPMFSVALILGGISRPDIGAGWNATLAVLIATLGVLAIGYVVALYARRFAGAGAVYEYLTHGAHPWVGVLVAGFFFIGVLFLGGGGIYLGLGILLDGFWTAHISDSGPAWWLWGAIALAVVLVLNYIGVRIAVRAMLTLRRCPSSRC
jgi:amino acid transporter